MKPLFFKISAPPPRYGSVARVIALSLGLSIAVLGATGCGSRISNRGNEISVDQVSSLEVGTHNRQQVVSMLGSPSSTASFGEEIWYYIFEKDESIAFLEPETLERTVLTLHFDKDGTLSEIESIGLEEAQVVTPVERETATAGNKLSFFEQMIANIGKNVD